MYGCLSIQVVFCYFAFLFCYFTLLFEELISVQSLSSFNTLAHFLLFVSSYPNYPGTHYLLSRCGEDVKLEQMVCFVLKTQGVPIYDGNKAADRILSYRAWFPVYLIVFYKRQYLRNLSLY